MATKQPIPFGAPPITKPEIDTQDLVKNKKPIPFGAPPVSFPTAQPPASHLSFMQKLGGVIKALPGQAVSDIKGGINNAKEIGSGVIQDFKEGGQNIVNDAKKTSFNVDYNPQTQQNIGTTVADVIGTIAKTAFSPISRTVGKFSSDTADKLADLPSFQHFANSPQGAAITGLSDVIGNHYSDWAKKNPELAKDLESAYNTAQLATAEKATPEIKSAAETVADTAGKVKDAVVPVVKDTAGKVVDAGKTVVDNTVGKAAVERDLANISDKKIQNSIDAVSPELSGKKLTQAYKDVVTGKRTTVGGKVFGAQDVGNLKDTIDLGTRLKDTLTSKNPIKNLTNLSTDLTKTEGSLKPLLENDKTPIVKQGLSDALDEKTQNMPREFIKDPDNTYQSVIDFAKEKINNAEPTINGMRNARIEFDAAAKREFPNAYKDGGYIDTKTPSGQAIKDARDTINKYMYDTAENGSEIQKLIGHEADIFKATDYIAPKAAAQHGLTPTVKLYNAIKAHPIASTAIGGYVGDKIIKTLTGGKVGF